MNKKEIAEIRKQFTPENCAITRICGCFVDSEKNKRMSMKEAFLSLPEEEMFKYMDIFKKTLSGHIGKNLMNLEYSISQEAEGTPHNFLMCLRQSKLTDDDMTDKFYDSVIEGYVSSEPYYIILIHAVYDIPGKTSDNSEMFDASDDIYEFIMCSICPVKLSKAALFYDTLKSKIENHAPNWIVNAPANGFLFPVFNDRQTDIHGCLYYSKKTNALQDEFVKSVLGCELEMSVEDQNEAFKDHTTPPEIVANAYYRDGLSAERTIYKGRFVVEETSDGKIWNTIYTSSEDETTITHYLYAFLDDGDGNIVTDEEGNAIAFVRDDIQQVRISLYAAGATATLLDRQTYVVILDVDSLTHEEIFNLLTNNGAVKGLYKIGNQVFFSFDYARGGELVLGGKNNGNGILRVLDENDTEIGKISRNGMALYRKVTIDNMDYDIEIDTVKSLVRTSFPNVFGEGRGYAQLQGNSCSAEIGDFDEINSSGEANLSGINNLDGTTNISGNNSLDGTTELKGTTNIYDLSIYSSGSYLRLAPDGKKIAYSSSSSKRYKKHMGYVTAEQAEGLYEIPVVWFQYKNGYLGEGDYLEGKDIPGLYAEDVSAFLPEAASIHMKKKDDSGTPTDEWQIEDWDMKTVIPLIIKLLQDQKEKIDKLTERVTTLEGGI